MKSAPNSKTGIGGDNVSINHEQLPSPLSLPNLLYTSNCLSVAQGTAAIGALVLHIYNETNINDKMQYVQEVLNRKDYLNRVEKKQKHKQQ